MKEKFFLLVVFVVWTTVALTSSEQGCPDDSYKFARINNVPRCYKTLEIKEEEVDRCKFNDVCRPLHQKAVPASVHSEEEQKFMTSVVTEIWTLIGELIQCPNEHHDPNLFTQVDGSPLAYPIDILNNVEDPELMVMLVKDSGKTDEVGLHPFFKYGAVTKQVLCSIDLKVHCPSRYYPLVPNEEVTNQTVCVSKLGIPSTHSKNLDSHCKLRDERSSVLNHSTLPEKEKKAYNTLTKNVRNIVVCSIPVIVP